MIVFVAAVAVGVMVVKTESAISATKILASYDFCVGIIVFPHLPLKSYHLLTCRFFTGLGIPYITISPLFAPNHLKLVGNSIFLPIHMLISALLA